MDICQIKRVYSIILQPQKKGTLEDNTGEISLQFPTWYYLDSGAKKNKEIEPN